jgi:tRNA(Ile)-lysidine synthase
LCLAYLLAGWGRPFALIVDHGLRPESAAEAAVTLARLAGFGVAGKVLTLRDLAPGPGLAARARAARYAALSAAAREAGCVDLLLGHQLLDQVETLLLRRGAGSGAAGLAGMASVSEQHDLRLVRPLLDVPPGRLRATLRAAGLAWVDDPSNRDPAATRARLRAGLDDPAGEGDAVAALAAEAASFGASRAAAEAATAATLAERVAIYPEGYALLSPGPVPVAALAALIRAIAGAAYPAATAQLARLAAKPRPAVLGGARLLPAGRLGPGWLVVREAAAMAPPVPARPGAHWDGRFELAAPELPDGATFGALGADAARLRRGTHLPSAVLRTLPALRLQATLAAVPHIGYLAPRMSDCMVARFRPANPLAPALFGVLPGDAQAAANPHVSKTAGEGGAG